MISVLLLSVEAFLYPTQQLWRCQPSFILHASNIPVLLIHFSKFHTILFFCRWIENQNICLILLRNINFQFIKTLCFLIHLKKKKKLYIFVQNRSQHIAAYLDNLGQGCLQMRGLKVWEENKEVNIRWCIFCKIWLPSVMRALHRCKCSRRDRSCRFRQ